MLDLVPIWTAIIGLGVFLYVLLDGFDLGVGILYGFAPDSRARAMVMNSIAPVWDGNETWLILGGVALLVGVSRSPSRSSSRRSISRCC